MRTALDADPGRGSGTHEPGLERVNGVPHLAPASGGGRCCGVLPGVARGASQRRCPLLGWRRFCAPGAAGSCRRGMRWRLGPWLPNASALQLAHPERKVGGHYTVPGFHLAENQSSGPVQSADRADCGQRWRMGAGAGNCSRGAGGAPTVACELQSARYDLVTKAFGGDGETIERPEEVARRSSGRWRRGCRTEREDWCHRCLLKQSRLPPPGPFR